MFCGKLAEFLPGGTTFLVRPDMPHESNSYRLAYLESHIHSITSSFISIFH